MGLGNSAKVAGGTGFRIFYKLKLFFYIFFVGLILIQAVVVSLEANDPEVGVKYVGNKLLMATSTLGEASRDIIENGFYDDSEGYLKGIWGSIKVGYGLFEALIIIYYWLFVLRSLWAWVIGDTGLRTLGYLLALMSFFTIQIIVLIYNGDSLITPFNDIIDFFKCIPRIVFPNS